MNSWAEAWSDDAGGEDDKIHVVTFDGDTQEVLGDFHPDRLADSGLVLLPDNGQLKKKREGSGWYLSEDGFTQQPPEGDR